MSSSMRHISSPLNRPYTIRSSKKAEVDSRQPQIGVIQMSTSAYYAFEQHQTGSSLVFDWLTRFFDEPSVRIHIRFFSPVSSNLRHGPTQH